MKAKHVPILYITIMLVVIALLMFIAPTVNAADPHHDSDSTVTTTTNTETETVTITRTDGNYGHMALASSGLVFDCCRPNALQWAAAMSFSEGGNQSIAFGIASNFGPVLINGRIITVLDSVDKENDYAAVVGFSGAFK